MFKDFKLVMFYNILCMEKEKNNDCFYGDFIKKERLKHGLSQKDLALFLSVSFQAISKYEKGEIHLDISLISKLCNIFHIDVDSFINKKDEWNNDYSLTHNFDSKKFAYSLIYLREKNMISQKSLAEELNISPSRLNKIENLSSLVKIEEFIKIAKYFNISYTELYFGFLLENKNEHSKKKNSIISLLNLFKKHPKISIGVSSFLVFSILLGTILPISLNLSSKKTVLNFTYYNVNENEVYINGIDLKTSSNLNLVENLTIPTKIDDKYVKGIKGNSLNELNNLKSIKIEEGVEFLEDYSISNFNKLESIELPSSINNIQNLALCNNPSLKNIKLDENNSNYSVLNNDLYSKDFKILYKVTNKSNTSLFSYDILEGVEIISTDAFSSLYLLKEVNFSSSLKEVYSNAFMSLPSLVSVNFNEGLKSLDFASFLACDNEDFNKIYIPSSLSIMTGNPFLHMPNLKNIIFNQNNQNFTFEDNLLTSKDKKELYYFVEDVSKNNKKEILPSYINEIYSGAINTFKNIKELIIPSSITFCDSFAIQNMTNLHSVYIEKGASNFSKDAITNSSLLDVYLEEDNLPLTFDKEFYSGDIHYGVDIPY